METVRLPKLHICCDGTPSTPSQCHPAFWYLSVGEGVLWPGREGQHVPQPLIFIEFPDLSLLLMLFGSSGIVSGSPVDPEEEYAPFSCLLLLNWWSEKYQAWLTFFCWLSGCKMPHHCVFPLSWGPQPVYLLLSTFQSCPLVSLMLFPEFIIVLRGEEQREMNLHHLVQAVLYFSAYY